MIAVTTPATIFELAELGGAQTSLSWRVLREMWKNGDTWSLWSGEDLVALIGLYPIDDSETVEAWFNVVPGASKHMLQILRHMRLTIQAGDYPHIVVICVTSAGKRIARACGFTFAETSDFGEVWKWTHYSAVAATKKPQRRLQHNRQPDREPVLQS